MPFLSNICKRRLVNALQIIDKQKLDLNFTAEEKELHTQLRDADAKFTIEYLRTDLPTNTYDKEQKSLFSAAISAENLANKYKK